MSKFPHRIWRKDQYLISTDSSLIPISKLNEAFASKVVYWCNPLPEEATHEMLQNSLCFGLYEMVGIPTSHTKDADVDIPSEAESSDGSISSPQTTTIRSALTSLDASSTLNFLGIARCVTDYTTFVYLTDTYVSPLLQGKGLGTWLVSCVQEVVDSMPHLRRSLLFTGDWERSVPFYEKHMGMTVLESKRSKDGKSGKGVAVMMRLGKGSPAYQATASP
jgi:Acetyltransferase (GNAT) family